MRRGPGPGPAGRRARTGRFGRAVDDARRRRPAGRGQACIFSSARRQRDRPSSGICPERLCFFDPLRPGCQIHNLPQRREAGSAPSLARRWRSARALALPIRDAPHAVGCASSSSGSASHAVGCASSSTGSASHAVGCASSLGRLHAVGCASSSSLALPTQWMRVILGREALPTQWDARHLHREELPTPVGRAPCSLEESALPRSWKSAVIASGRASHAVGCASSSPGCASHAPGCASAHGEASICGRSLNVGISPLTASQHMCGAPRHRAHRHRLSIHVCGTEQGDASERQARRRASRGPLRCRRPAITRPT